MSRFRFISEHRAVFGVKRLCRVLKVSRSGFYAWLAGIPKRAGRVADDNRLLEQIQAIHRQTGGAYGSPRVTVELHAQGVVVNHKRVERLMRQHGVVGIHLRRGRKTTIPSPAAITIPDLLGRDFTATAPDRRWVGRHHLPARRHVLAVPGHRGRPVLTAAGRLEPHQSPARRAGDRRAGLRGHHPWPRGRRGLSR